MTDRIVNPFGEAGSTTSLSLLDRARANDPAAWERLVSLYSPLVDWWCHRYRLQEADLADVRQQVFLAVARRLADFRRDRRAAASAAGCAPSRGTRCTTIGGAEATRCRAGGSDAYEQLQQLSAGELEDAAAGSTVEEQGILYRRAVQLIARDFEEKTRKAFWMVTVEDRLPAEVAEELGISTNAVYLAKSRVLAHLREEFGDPIDQ